MRYLLVALALLSILAGTHAQAVGSGKIIVRPYDGSNPPPPVPK